MHGRPFISNWGRSADSSRGSNLPEQQHSNLRSFVIDEQPLPDDQPDTADFINKAILGSLLPQDRDVDLYFLGPKKHSGTENPVRYGQFGKASF